MYSYCYICSFLGILCHCFVLCIFFVCVWICTSTSVTGCKTNCSQQIYKTSKSRTTHWNQPSFSQNFLMWDSHGISFSSGVVLSKKYAYTSKRWTAIAQSVVSGCGLDNLGLDSREEHETFPSPNLPGRVLCNSYWGFCRWDCSDRCLLLTAHLHLVPRLDMSGAVPLLPPPSPVQDDNFTLYVTGVRRSLSNMSLCSVTSSRDAVYAVTMILTDNVKKYVPKASKGPASLTEVQRQCCMILVFSCQMTLWLVKNFSDSFINGIYFWFRWFFLLFFLSSVWLFPLFTFFVSKASALRCAK